MSGIASDFAFLKESFGSEIDFVNQSIDGSTLESISVAIVSFLLQPSKANEFQETLASIASSSS